MKSSHKPSDSPSTHPIEPLQTIPLSPNATELSLIALQNELASLKQTLREKHARVLVCHFQFVMPSPLNQKQLEKEKALAATTSSNG